MTAPIMAAGDWPTNAHLIEAIAHSDLPYLEADARTLDPTYGMGAFWRRWTPDELVASDLDPAKSPAQISVDFRHIPEAWGQFDRIVFDGPYKLNGTPSDPDVRYGVAQPTRWQDRHLLIRQGLHHLAGRLHPKGYLLLKSQAQVCSGAVRWQPDEFTLVASTCRLRKVDEFHLPSYRPQPERTRKHKACKGTGCGDCVDGRVPSKQHHAARNFSTLTIFRKERTTT